MRACAPKLGRISRILPATTVAMHRVPLGEAGEAARVARGQRVYDKRVLIDKRYGTGPRLPRHRIKVRDVEQLYPRLSR